MTQFGTDLLNSVQKSFAGYLMRDKDLKRIANRVRDGTDYQDANEYAVRVGELLSKSIDDNTQSLAYMSEEVARELLTPLLSETHDLVAGASAQVQKNMNNAAGIGLEALEPDLDTNRIDGLVNKVASYDTYDEARWVMHEPVVNYHQAIVDQAIRKNASAHTKAGFDAVIIRKTEAHKTITGRKIIRGKAYPYKYTVPCKWCAGLEGVYRYKDVSNTGNDVFRRHEACRCIIIYKDGNKTIDVRTQHEWTGEDADRIAARIGRAEQAQQPQTEAPPNNAIYDAYGSEAYAKMQEVAAQGDEKCREFWNNNVQHIGVAETNRTDGKAFCDWQRRIHLSLRTEMNPVRIDETPFEVTFHEGFHALDMFYGEKVGKPFRFFSELWDNGRFPATIEAEVQRLVKERGNRIKELMTEKNVTGLKDMMGLRWYRYYFGYGRDNFEYVKYEKAMAYKALEHEARMLPDVERGRLSNVLNGATKGKINCGYAHANDYWRKSTRNGVNAGLAAEAAAEFFDTSMANKAGFDAMKKYLPESYATFTEMFESMGKV